MAESSLHAREAFGNFGRSLYDAAFHTREYTPGAQIQRPRKIPVRLEPKTWFANERTFLAWAGIAVMFGTASTVLSGLTPAENSPRGPMQEKSLKAVSLLLAPVAATILLYGLFIYLSRMYYLENKLVGHYDAKLGPISMALIIAAALMGITFTAYYDFFINTY